jgi:uncharacterized membrane protein YqjE
MNQEETPPPADAPPPESPAPEAARDEPQHSSQEAHPARELSLHLLRMLETRMDAAGIALQGETQRVLARLQLKILSAAAIFIAIWGGIVLLAIALPPHLRVPVLGAVVAAFVLTAVAAQVMAKRKASSREVGSMHWFLDSLRQDLEVWSRALARSQQTARNDSSEKSTPDDIAA